MTIEPIRAIIEQIDGEDHQAEIARMAHACATGRYQGKFDHVISQDDLDPRGPDWLGWALATVPVILAVAAWAFWKWFYPAWLAFGAARGWWR